MNEFGVGGNELLDRADVNIIVRALRVYATLNGEEGAAANTLATNIEAALGVEVLTEEPCRF